MIHRYFTIANLLLITVGVYLCVSAFYTFVTARLDHGISSGVTANPAVSSTAAGPSYLPLADYAAIAKRNIFNSSDQEQAAAPVVEETLNLETLKETNLKLKLWGTVTGQNEGDYAVIEDAKAREQNLYRAGDTIQNAVVKLILREKVVLKVGDNDEILAMEENIGQGRRSPAARRDIRSPSSPSPAERLPVSSYPRKIRLQADQVEKAMENLGELMEQATLRPHIEDGQSAGISITGIKPNAIFRKMRLRNGDIITGVNGDAIESVEDAVKVVEQLSSGSDIQLQIKRRGREQSLDYNIE
ncbi:MAG: type II secretion system protein GspC [Desulfobacterales bacterium]|jgi:general secretion pathway protein C